MIKAYDAYLKTKFQKQMVDFRADIEKAIEEAISKGKYECEVAFDSGMPDTIRDDVALELMDLDYAVLMPKYEEQSPNIPLDQCRYYDYLKIEWGGDRF